MKREPETRKLPATRMLADNSAARLPQQQRARNNNNRHVFKFPAWRTRRRRRSSKEVSWIDKSPLSRSTSKTRTPASRVIRLRISNQQPSSRGKSIDNLVKQFRIKSLPDLISLACRKRVVRLLLLFEGASLERIWNTTHQQGSRQPVSDESPETFPTNSIFKHSAPTTLFLTSYLDVSS